MNEIRNKANNITSYIANKSECVRAIPISSLEIPPLIGSRAGNVSILNIIRC